MLIDTNVWSELARPRPDERVLRFLDENRRPCFLSTIVLSEIEYGIAKATDPTHRRRLLAWFDTIHIWCADRILEPDQATAAVWGRLKASLEAQGRMIADMDLLIASQAIAAQMPLATRNVSDMARTGAVIVNPWEG
ncbi:MAG: type II toxin-antitoxin system VapC family toxin [Sphingomonadaceae bacterium]